MSGGSAQIMSEAPPTWTDQELITEWMKATWESGDPHLIEMVNEIEPPGLGF